MECLKHPNMSVVKMYSSLTHGLISLPLSVFGVILNMIVISIFLQKRMRNQTNQVLIGISLFDMLMMLAYIPNSIYFYIVNDPSPLPERSEFWLYFLLIFYHFTVFTHACSVWLTCYLAFYRLITVAHCVLKKIKNEKILKQNVTKVMGFIVFFVLLFMSCNFFAYDVKTSCTLFLCDLNYVENGLPANLFLCPANNATVSFESENNFELNLENQLVKNKKFFSVWMEAKWLSASDIGMKYPNLISVNLWIHGIMYRILPCILLLVFSALLIYVMSIANSNKKKLQHQEQQQTNEFNKTTTMLLLIIFLFLLMEFPHGLAFLIGTFSTTVYYDIYDFYGEFLDILVLLNSSVNFFLYCLMSSEFRKTFRNTYTNREGFLSMFRSHPQAAPIQLKRLSKKSKKSDSSKVSKTRSDQTEQFKLISVP